MPNDQNDAASVWNEQAATWDDREEAHVYASQAFETLEPVVSEHLGTWENLRVLDFGAGTGMLTAKLASRCREVVAIDIAAKMVEVLASKVADENWDNVTAVAGALEGLTDRGAVAGPFDLVVASSVCSFLPDFAAELMHIASLLRPGGLFVQWDWNGDAAGDWAMGFTHEQIRTAYAEAALELVSVDVGFTFQFDGRELEVLMGVGRR